MKPSTLVMLLFALGSGLGAMVLFNKYVQKEVKVEGTKLLVAADDIAAGTPLNDHNVTEIVYLGPLPKDFKKPEEKEKLFTRVAAVKIFKDEPIREVKLGRKGDAGMLQVMLRKREDGEMEQGVTVKVQTAGATAGFVRPDSLVDVLLTLNQSGNQRAKTYTILRRMRVIAVNSQMQNSGEGTQSAQGQNVEMVTFAATHKEAQILALAENAGMLKLSLRSTEDKTTTVARAVTLEEVLSGKQSTSAAEEKAEASEKLDPKLVQSNPKQGLLDSLTSMFGDNLKKAADGKAEPVNAENPKVEEAPKEVVKSAIEATPKKKWKLTHKDQLGNTVMEVILDDDSKWVRSLKDLGLLEPIDGGEAGLKKDGGTRVQPIAPKPAASAPKAAKKK